MQFESVFISMCPTRDIHGLGEPAGRVKIFVNHGLSGRIGSKILEIYSCWSTGKNVCAYSDPKLFTL